VSALPAGRSFSPLDEELALLPGCLTPQLQEALAHLGSWMPFAQAAALLGRFTGVAVSASTALRQTELVGRAGAAVQLGEVERLEQDLSALPVVGPDQALVSVDGAMVPLRGGEWGEVKTLVVGRIAGRAGQDAEGAEGSAGAAPASAGAEGAKASELSYFSRLADAELFSRLALGELHCRGVATAGRVAAVSDGAEWIQGFLDLHCPHAVRILDFPHAAERLTLLSQTLAPADTTWLPIQAHRLKHEGPAQLLVDLREQVAAYAGPTGREPPAEVSEALAYLEKRAHHMHYPAYMAAGWPIGSGVVESANKLVVEARLKGAGMHWARPSVNSMLTLRTAVCSDRWDAVWQESSAYLRQHRLPRVPAPATPAPPPPAAAALATPPAAPAPQPPAPVPTHPWRRYGRWLSAKT
jgi:hypothetical protein